MPPSKKNLSQISDKLKPVYEKLGQHYRGKESNDPSLIYGEIELSSLEKIARNLHKPGGTFYDLGCGRGKAVIFMGLTGLFKSCIGIEIVQERIELANEALSLIPCAPVQFYSASFLDPKFDYSSATVVYTNNLVFTPELNIKLFRRLLEMKPGTCVLCNRLPQSIDGFEQEGKIDLAMSWEKQSFLYVLSRL
jgi:ubiquinone/menaquinone biosynthesis C-methylase UbiE